MNSIDRIVQLIDDGLVSAEGQTCGTGVTYDAEPVPGPRGPSNVYTMVDELHADEPGVVAAEREQHHLPACIPDHDPEGCDYCEHDRRVSGISTPRGPDHVFTPDEFVYREPRAAIVGFETEDGWVYGIDVAVVDWDDDTVRAVLYGHAPREEG